MTTRGQRSRLIAPDTVDRIFDSAVILRIARCAKIPADADIATFGCSVRGAAREYLSNATAPHPGEHREALEELAHHVRLALDGDPSAPHRVVDALESLHPETQRLLDQRTPLDREVPTREELLDPDDGREALILLSGLCHRSGTWKPGRMRPGGKQSRPTLQADVIGPHLRRGRPSDVPEFILCSRLGGAYCKATGRILPRRSNSNDPGPFARLVHEVLCLLGASNVNAIELVNRYGAELPRRVSPN